MLFRTSFALFTFFAGCGAVAAASGCGSTTDDANGGSQNGTDAGASIVDAAADALSVEHPDASCFVEIQEWPKLDSPHIGFGDSPTYNSNPPSSGPHYPVWAAFKDYTTAVDRRYYVHNMEHGGVVLLYKCDKPEGCPDVADAIKIARDGITTDPLCDPAVRVRAVITPDPLLDTPVAAAAWGFTYKAACVDIPTLTAFANAHQAKGPENLCANGQESF